MKINLMTDYAMRTIRSIAENESGIVTSTSIAEKEDIPHGVLMKVLRRLRMNNIIDSHRGRGEFTGGYSLGVSVGEITLLRIIEIMEGPIELSYYKQKKSQEKTQTTPENDDNSKQDGIEMEYQRISEILKQEMGRYSIRELLHLECSE